MALLEVENLKTHFFTSEGVVKAVDDVSFKVPVGKVFGLAGESGCGKTTTAHSIIHLLPLGGKIIAGKILFEEDLIKKKKDELRDIRWQKISIARAHATIARAY